jgi:selenocysteine-specific elongation factor
MVAGIAAHQYALVVVAVDDGVMPQTREHLAILELLGVTRGVVALTKVDRAAASRIAEVRRSAIAVAETSGLMLSGTVETSIVTGAGLDDLRGHIARAAQLYRADSCDHEFRLAIDRAFVIKGSGVVVTGTVHSGALSRGDELTIAPSGVSARARSLRVSDEPAERASVSDRCAVNLAGVSLEQVARGDWLVAPSTLAPSRNVVIDLRIIDDFPRSVRHWLPIHVYHAASHAQGHVALLETTRVGAGQSALVELVLDTPLHPKYGDRLIVRDAARELTIGGGAVIDTVSPPRGRRTPARIARLQAQRAEDPVVALRTLLANDDVELEAFKRSRNLTDAALAPLLGAVDPVQLQRDGRTTVLVSRDGWQSTLEALCAQISAYHKSAPHSPGLKADQIRRTGIVPKRWLDDALAALVSQHRVSESSGHFHDPAHRPALPPDDAALLKRIEAIIGEGDRPPSIGDIAKALATPLRPLDGFVARMAKLGLLVRVGDNRVLLSRHVDSLSALAQALLLTRPEGFSAREFRDAARIGRNFSIDVLEYFDRCGYTRRYGDLRRIVGAPSMLRR